MRLLTISIALVTWLLIGGCSPGETMSATQEEATIDQAPEQKELPDNYIRLDEPMWLPTFNVPEGWEPSPSYPGYLRSTSTKFTSSFINIEIRPKADDPAQLRDELYEHQYCPSAAEHSKYNIFSDCQRGFHKSTTDMEGYMVQVLKYFGTWRNKTDEVVEIFFQHPQFIVALNFEGDYVASQGAISEILSSLAFEFKKLDRNINEQELGGL
jgi:hypothetical protein